MLELESLPSFPSPSFSDWQDKVKKELKIKDLEKLTWKCLEGVSIQALYTSPKWERDTPYPAAKKWIPHQKNIPWESICPLPGYVWKKQIEEALSTGISHFWLPSNPAFDPKELIAFFSSQARTDLQFATSGNLWMELSHIGEMGSISNASFPEFTEVFRPTKHIDWDFRLIYEQGGDLAQQIAVVLAALVEAEQIGDKEEFAQQLKNQHIHLSVGTGFYREIAKFRVLPLLIQRVLQELELAHIQGPKIIAHTSERDLGQKDPAMNALRNSYAALAAIIGGCTGLCIHPLVDQIDLFQLRLARNTHFLLQQEGKIQQVEDPLGGAYFIEELGEAIGVKAWSHFLQIEEEGGLQKAREKGLIKEWMKAGAERDDNFKKNGHKVKIGENI